MLLTRPMAQSVDSDGGREPMAAMVAAAPFALALASLAFGLALLHAHPVMYWYDSYSRFFLRGQVIMARWLPLLQVVVFAVGKVTDRLLALRVVMPVIAAL